MSTEARRRADDFYQRIVNRAPMACCRWSRAVVWADRSVILRPADGVQPIPGWPKVHGAPGFVLDVVAVEDAFTEILRLASPIKLDLDDQRRLHLAEQEADDTGLDDRFVDLVVQVAVFGWGAL